MGDPHKLTYDEHVARAMLMGLEYVDWAHAYMPPSGSAGRLLPHEVIDADTLKPLPDNIFVDRIEKTFGGYGDQRRT